MFRLQVGCRSCFVVGRVELRPCAEQGSPSFACLFCIAVSLKMVSKWSSEDVVKFLDVCKESEGLWNIRHSDYNSLIKRDSAVLKLMGKLLKRNVAVKKVEVMREKIITSSVAFSPHCPKVTGK